METEDPRTSSRYRQYSIIFILNLVPFLQGASVGMGAISIPRMPRNETERITRNDTTWPMDFVVTKEDEFWINYSWLISFIVSGLVSNCVAEILGRKNSLLIDCLAFAIGYALYAMGENTTTLCVARAFLGYPLINLVFCLELTNVSVHGLAAAVFALLHSLGGSSIALLGALHPLWRVNMLAMAILSFVAFVIIYFTIPESPSWLLRKNREADAKGAMRRIYGDERFLEEFEKLKFVHGMMMTQARSNRNSSRKWSEPLGNTLADLVKGRQKIPKPPFSFTFLFIQYLFIGWSGMLYITLNGPKLFSNQAEDIGIDKYYMNFIVSLGKIAGAIFSTIFLNRLSRRPVFLTSALLVAVSHVIIGLTSLKLLPSWCAMVGVGAIQFALTAGYISVSALLLGSLLPSSSRSVFAGIIKTFETLSALSQGSVEPYIVKAFGEASLYFIFAGVVTISLVYMFFLMPETKGRTLEEIEHIFLSPKQKGCNVRRDPKEAIAQAANIMTRVPIPNMIRRFRTRRFRVAASAVIASRSCSTTEAPHPLSDLNEGRKEGQQSVNVTILQNAVLKMTPSNNEATRYI